MSKFGDAALAAAKRCRRMRSVDVKVAWRDAVISVTSSSSMREQCCPWGAFLGLYETGQLKGIAARARAPSTKNGRYALEALAILRSNGARPATFAAFWRMIRGAPKRHNNQLNVVLALWDAGLIEKRNGD